ncbi:MAG: hypothetical protein V1492_03460 [Candidatus Micrarchaeota archaeon]
MGLLRKSVGSSTLPAGEIQRNASRMIDRFNRTIYLTKTEVEQLPGDLKDKKKTFVTWVPEGRSREETLAAVMQGKYTCLEATCAIFLFPKFD